MELPENVVKALNSAKVASKAQQRVEYLGQLHELLVRSNPAHLDTVLPEIIEFQVDRAESVRKAVVQFAAAAVQARCDAGIVSQAAACLLALLSDPQTAVVKQAAIAAHGVIRAGLTLHMSSPQGDANIDAAWTAAQQLQAAVSAFTTSSNDTGLRMAGIKMSEQAAVLYTAPEALALPDAAALVTTAGSLVKVLVELLKEPAVLQLPGPVAICCIKALGAVVMQRANMMHRGMPALLALATKGIFRVPNPGDGLTPTAASCGTALKDMLNRIMRSNPEATKPWLKRLEAALRAMGADALADSALRHIERQAARLRANEKRKAADQGGPDPKLSRGSTPTVPDSSVTNTPARTPTPTPNQQQQQQQQQGGNDLLSRLLGGQIGSGDRVTDTQRVFEALVQGQQMVAVETILAQIDSNILAELVVRWMINLPPQPAAAAAAAAAETTTPVREQDVQQPSLAAAVTTAAVAAPTSQAAPQEPPLQQQQQQQKIPLPQAVQQQEAPQPQQQPQQQQLVDPRKLNSQAAKPPPPPPPAAAGPPLPSPLPLTLNASQIQQMRKSAVQRILAATKNRPIRNFRELLLSRLASQAPADDGLSDLVLQNVLQDYNGCRGQVLVVRWMYALAAALAAAGETGSTAAAAAGEGQIVQRQQRRRQQTEDEEMQDAVDDVGNGDGEPWADQSEQQQQQQQQVDCSSNNGTGAQASAANDLSGTTYDTMLVAILQGLRNHLPSSDPAIPKLLQELPVLPLMSTVNFLRELLAENSEWAAVALSSAAELFDSRPPMRGQLLHFVLDAAVISESVTREQAVGLVVSKLITWKDYAEDIVEFARQQLLLLLEPRKLMQQHMKLEAEEQQQQQQGQVEMAESDNADATAANGVTKKQQQQQEDAAADQQDAEPQQQQQEVVAPDQAQQQQQQDADGDNAAAAAAQDDNNIPPLDVEVAAQHCMLFMSLCAVKPELLTTLLETYGQAGSEARSGMERYAASLAKAIGPDQPELLSAISAPPPGAQDLLLVMISALADSAAASKQLVAACIASYNASKQVLLLAPVTPALPKNDVIKLMPQMVAQLSRPQLRLLYRRLTGTAAAAAAGADGAAAAASAHFKPTELLVALHQIKSTATCRVTTKQQTAALDVALHAPEVFPVAVAVQAIRRLESMTPLPQLFMRTVITALQITPKLTDTIMELLRRLIQKQIWLNDKQWQGFIICCDKAAPASYPVLLQLPSNILEQAMEKLPEKHWRALLAYATSKECSVPVFGPTREVLKLFLERLSRRQGERAAAAGVAGTAAAAAGGSSSAAKARPTAQVKKKAATAVATAKSAKIAEPAAAAAAGDGEQQQEQKAEVAASNQQQQQAAAVGSDDGDAGNDDFMLDFEDDE